MTVQAMYVLSRKPGMSFDDVPNFIGKFAILPLDDDVVIDKTAG